MAPRISRLGLVVPLIAVLSLLLGISPVNAATITVDDADSAIKYTGNWNIGNECPGCYAQPSKDQVSQGTWHDATRGNDGTEYYFEYTFRGTGLYVYGILIDIIRTTYLFTTNVDLTLAIDGQTKGTYTYNPAVNLESYQYHVQVFAVNGLSDASHTVRVSLNPSSAFLFDGLAYTTAEGTTIVVSDPSSSASTLSSSASAAPSQSLTSTSTSKTSTTLSSSSLSSVPVPSLAASTSTDSSGVTHTIYQTIGSSNLNSSSSLSTGTIIGIVAGVLGLLLLLLLCIAILCYKKRQSRRANDPQVAPSSNPTGELNTQEPLMHGVTPSLYQHPYNNATSLNSETGAQGSNPYASTQNISAYDQGVTPPPAVTGFGMNSKQRRLQTEQALLPSQTRNSYGYPAWVLAGASEVGSSSSSGGRLPYERSSHTGDMTTYSGSTDYGGRRTSTAELLPNSGSSAGVGGSQAPWNRGLSGHAGPAALAAPVPVPLGAPINRRADDLESEFSSSMDGRATRASDFTRPPTAPPPYRSPPPSTAPGPFSEYGRGTSITSPIPLGTLSEYQSEKE